MQPCTHAHAGRRRRVRPAPLTGTSQDQAVCLGVRWAHYWPEQVHATRACACVHVLWTVPWPSGCLPVCLRACMCGSCAGGWPCLVVEVHVGAEGGRRVGHRHGAHQRQDLNIPHSTHAASGARQAGAQGQPRQRCGMPEAACGTTSSPARGQGELEPHAPSLPFAPPSEAFNSSTAPACCKDVCACRASITTWLCMALHGA